MRRAERLGLFANAAFDVIAAELQWASACPSSKCDVDVRMDGVEVRDGNPFQRRAQVLLHSAEKIAGESAEVGAFAEFRGDYHLEKPLVAGRLPAAQYLCDFDPVFAG